MKVHIVDADSAPAAVRRLAAPTNFPACWGGAVDALPDDILTAWYKFDIEDLPAALRDADGQPDLGPFLKRTLIFSRPGRAQRAESGCPVCRSIRPRRSTTRIQRGLVAAHQRSPSA